MVRLRKSKNKLKIILCCILGFIVAVGGIVGILVLVPLMEGEKEPPVVDSAVNEKNDPGDMTYEQHAASGDDGYRTLTYLAYVLSEQPYYHSESVTVSVAPFNMTQYTKSFKDYSDGIMISSDLTYGIKNAGTQAAFVPGGNEEGRGAGVYMRTSSGSVNADSTGTSVSWNDDVVYYDRESYLYAYGEYSTEMTVYLLTEETITSWDPATDNGDGTYTQTFYLDAEKACYYYQYAMKTRGGLLTLPVFESISMEVTFDNNYRVLQIDVVENSRINPFTWMDSTSTTTTSYTYGEENFDRPHYDYYADYFEQYVGNLGSEDGDDDELTPLDLLMNAFAGVLNGEGQQFDAVVMAGGKTYYGRVYLSLDINGISSGDILGSIDARIALSEDENIDEQDLYISFADGDIRAYYSSDFALSADVNEFSDIVSQFESWVQRLSGDGTAAADEGDSADEGGFSLDELLQQFTNGTTVEYDGGLTYTASLEISGISLDAVFDFSEQDGGDAATYSLNSAQIGGIAYNGSPVELSLALEPSEGEIISHEESETPFDLSVAAQNLYELLNSDAIGVEISLGGEKLADFLSSLGIADLGASLDDLSLQISGAVDINGITVAAAFALSDINSGRTVLAADVYYVYNDGSGEYGTAYLNISNILGAETSAKVYCDIAELAATIQTLIDRLSSGDGAEGVSEDSEGAVSAADGSDMVSLINGILGLDLGAVVKEVNAGAAVIGATVDLDSVFALLGADVSLGDITLEYHLGDFDREDYNNAGGWLYGSIPSLGAEAYIYGSDAAVGGIEKDDYLDLDELIGSVAGVIDSAVVEINLKISGGALADVLASNGIVDLGDSADGLVLDIEGSVSASELEARLELSLHDENKIYFAADAYYVYGGEGYGTAYIDLTHILGASYDGIKVYCDIAELASAVGWLVDDAAGQSEGAGTEESAGIAGIITGILTIDLGGIVKELSANADGITTTVDIGGILEYFTETDIKLGDVTLEYTFGEGGGRLSGTALGGGLTMSVTGSDAEISAPDTEEYYDLTALVNSIYEIFESNTVRVLLDITGEALSEILAENGITGADELLAGANIHVSGNIDIDTLAVKGTLSFSGADRTYFAADVFYSYDEDGYGDIYLSITELLGSECNIKVYGNIGDMISSVEELIGTATEGGSADGAASDAEVSQVADIVSQILSINLGSIVRWLRIDEYGVYASVDIDNLLGSLTGTELGLGSMQMQYDGHFLSGTAMNGGLELLLYGSDAAVGGIEKDDYLDLDELIGSVAGVIDSAVVEINLKISGGALADVLASNGIVDLGDSADGLVLDIEGSVSASELEARLELSLHDENKIYFAADAYYVYGGEGYGTAYIDLTHILGASYDGIKVYCDIAELASAVGWLVDDAAGQSEGAGTEESAGIAGIITGILTIDLGGIVKELSANADGITTTVDIGGILEYFTETDIKLGDVTLEYTFGEGGGRLSGTALGGGLTMSVTGSDAEISAPDTEEYYDLTALVNSIYEIFESNTVRVLLDITGEALSEILAENGITGADELLAGANIHVSGNIDIDTLAVKGTLSFSGADRTYFAADVFYSYDEDGYGDIYLSITELLGSECNIKVYGNIGDMISSVEELIGTATEGGSADGAASDAEVSQVADIVSQILSINLGSIVRWLRIDEYGVYASVDIDNLLGSLTGTELGLGSMQMQYDGHFLSGTAMNGGLELLLYGSEMNAYRPDPDAYLDIVDLLALINNAKAAVQKIIDGNSVYFSIANAEIAVNGVTFSVSGEGEAVWDDVSLVSLALDLTFATGGKDGTSENTVKLIYNAGAADDEPLVQLAINEVGLIITQNDMDRFGEDLNGLIAAINNLLGGTAGSSTGNADDSQLVSVLTGGDSTGSDVAGILQLILGIFNDGYEEGTVGNALAELLDGLYSALLKGGMDIEDGQLTVNVGGLNVTFGADPDKGLYLSGSVENIAGFNAGVSAGTGSYAPEFADGTVFYSSAADGNSGGSFTRAIYNFIFGTYESVDIGSFLGGDAYSVNIKLTGDNSGIEALKGVAVNADLYFAANKAEGAVADQKIAGADIAVTADSFTFAADFIFSGDMLYITLTEINGAELNIVLKASADNIYRAVENLIKVVQNDKIVSLVSGLFGGQAAADSTFEDIATYGGPAAGPESDNIADLISAILNFKYSEIIGISSDEDSFVATLNIDELLDALNVNAGTPIGTATLRLAGGENRGIYIGIDDWLTVNAQPDKDIVITVPEDSDDIIDIGFVADLIDDVNKFVSSNKEGNGTVYTFYTQSMAMEYSVIKINIKDLYVSIGILDGELYVSAEGEISISIDLFDIGEDWDIDIAGVDFGLTLYNDYLTFARDVGGARPYYWVMTPDYFLENLFAKQDDGAGTDSPLRWLFSISSGTWDFVANNVNLDIGSDEDAPVTVDIGGGTADTAADSSENADQNSGGIAVTNYVNYFISKIVLNGVNCEYFFGIPDNLLENLGLANANDFYAFSVADGVIDSLTGGALTMLDVGITRDQSNGIGSVIADTSLGGQLTVNLSMQYQPERDMVENYFNAASEAAKSYSGDSAYDFSNEIGYEDYSDYYRGTYVAGVKVEPLVDGATDFNYVYAEDIVNDYYSITVRGLDGGTIYSGNLKHGDTINFYENGIYPSSDANGNIVVYLWNNGGVNEAYASYTIDGGHTAGNKPEGNTLVFTAATVEYSVEENGVVYTFVGSNEHSNEPHYAITGTGSGISEYYSNDSVLVLENEINGFPVVEIASGAFDNSESTGRNKDDSELRNNSAGSLKNVVVPDKIKWIGGRAFLDNKGIQSIVFLAPSVEFSNDMTFYNMHGTNGGNSSADKQNFPFYGCGTDDSNTNLKIYYNSTISTSNYIFCFSRTTDWIGRETLHYVNSAGGEVHSAGTWTYIEYALSEDSVINEAGLSEDVIFSGLQFVTTASVSADMIAEIVLENIDAFTAENCGYINGYYVDVIVEQVNNRATVTVSLAEEQEQERYYAADSLEISSTVEGADTELDLFEITYAEFKPYGADGRIFVKADSDVIFTLKQEFADYYSLSKVGDNEADGDSYVFDSMTDAVNFGKITLDFEAIGNYVTVYSDISFAYGGAQYAGDSSANQMLVGASVTELGIPSTTNSGYYFLGWATNGNSGLEFNSAVADSAIYYAIWVNSSVPLNLSPIISGSSVTSADIVKADSNSQGSDPKLYSDSSFVAEVSGISESCTIIYARWAFNVSTSTNNADVDITASSLTGKTTVFYEKEEVKFTVSYDGLTGNSFSVKAGDTKIDCKSDGNNGHKFEMPASNVTIDASSCIAAGSLITLADGSQKKVEDLTGDELLLVWNLETGTFDTAPIVFIDSDAECEYEIINLIFSDGTKVKVISEHAFWDYDLNEYVYLDRYAGKYIGHWFNKQTTDDDGNFANTAVQLTDVVITYEVTSAYSPVTYSHLCYYVNGMLSMPGGISGLFNIFEVDPDTMMYDREAMEADIAEYGLFTYEDFEGLISEEVFEAFNGKYLKVAIGKGILTWDDIFYLVERYSQFF